ncbi:MAG: hypothetical protein PPP58_06935 [Natronomonas sp.]
MAEIEIKTGLRDNTIGMIEEFAAIAATDPLVAAMMLTGFVFVGFASAVFGALVVGAFGSAIRQALPDLPAVGQQGR